MPRHVHKTHVRTKGNQPDKLHDWLQHLTNASKNCCVLVQHKHDADVLSSLGVNNVIWHADGEPDYNVLDRIGDKECILLFDADRPSNERCERIKQVLEENGIKTNTRFRKVLFTTEFKEVGAILAYFDNHIATTSRRSEK